ncbi:hypothetical protein SAY86_012700 [Trapa natans]|uniref:CID domain-containing protein n=1 Tax=Trapa natans TaxID=22666 RepID=A0AAN7MDL6_TRANT|nr:hypothetical protein SAY86_012700 [Trapa natans]
MGRGDLATMLPPSNARNLKFLNPMPNELPPHKSAPSILERFRALLKLRGEKSLSPPSSNEIVRIYESLLSELTFNSKPIITDLTRIADEQKDHGAGIADAICARIIEAPLDQKLPSLYLLDSIVKNIPEEFVRHFSSRLPEVFCKAYWKMDPSMYGSMRDLFGTWSAVFPAPVLQKIESELNFSNSGLHQTGEMTSLRSPQSPRPSHGIHVNPKYVRQSEHAAMDNVGSQRWSAGQYGGPPSLNSDKLRTSLRSGSEMLSSSDIDDFFANNPPRKVEMSSPSHSGFPYVQRRLGAGQNYYSENPHIQLDASTASTVINEREHQNLRALIDAYGSDDRDSYLKSNPLFVDGVGTSKVAMPSWQDTEEQEFDWEDMSPTLANAGRRNEILPFGKLKVHPSNSLDHDSGSMKLSAFRSKRKHISASGDSQEAIFMPENYSDSRHSERGTSRNLAVAFSSRAEPLNTESNFPHPTVSKEMFQPINLHKSQRSLVNPIPPSIISMNPAVFINKQRHMLSHQSHQAQTSLLPLQFMHEQPNENFHQPPVSASFSEPAPHLNYSSVSQGPLHALPPAQLNLLPVVQTPLPMSSIPSSSLHLSRGPMPPPSLGPPPTSLPALTVSQGLGAADTNQVGGAAYTGLINTLMAQGLITLENQAPVQKSVVLEFDAEPLKVRHESAIRILYADLPRQCTTCGLRFRGQDEHSRHMDWHVTKNRNAKNRKHKSSRKWFVSTSMWLSGAEALGVEPVPGFLPVETVEEKKSDEEMAVPADENQTACALCGESFDDFYSDDRDEWMYKGTVYMNAAPDGSTAGLDRSLLGPIVHAKCKSESSGAPPENFGREGGGIEEGSQRKRLRTS